MRIALACLIVALVVGVVPKAFAFGYIAPEAIEAGVAECAEKNLKMFSCARGIEQKELSARSKVVSRSGYTLLIRLEKKVVSLVDYPTESGDSAIWYSYLGYSRKLNSHIIHVQYYEGDSYMVIHHHSGQQVFPSGFPLASPDGKHFLSISNDMFAGYRPNNVEIWQVGLSDFHRIANYEPEWGPHDGGWESANHALVKKQCYAAAETNPTGLKPCGVAQVKHSGSTWMLIE
ncbi:hypothetical protein [Methylotenera sp. L2L1]|uniref:hypothetical protein n=1 Tax=Methylotenera sp. L2L1 TaxID=1502770 RepID=UPI00055D33BE|nr:hypothetical protein [Methylotenera sp. L2L1]